MISSWKNITWDQREESSGCIRVQVRWNVGGGEKERRRLGIITLGNCEVPGWEYGRRGHQDSGGLAKIRDHLWVMPSVSVTEWRSLGQINSSDTGREKVVAGSHPEGSCRQQRSWNRRWCWKDSWGGAKAGQSESRVAEVTKANDGAKPGGRKKAFRILAIVIHL